MRRFGQVIGIGSEQIARYENMHSHVWAEALEPSRTCSIRDHSTFRHGQPLFTYFEADMARIAPEP